jgi:uncharacterized membrane protein YqjE
MELDSRTTGTFGLRGNDRRRDMLFAVVIIFIISVVLALWSLRQQNKLEEIGKIKKELQNSRVIYQRDSSLEE